MVIQKCALRSFWECVILEINEDKTKYYCRVPDLPGCITTADTIDHAIEMITDAASGWLVVAEDCM